MSILAIDDGGERLTRSLLETVAVDYAAELASAPRRCPTTTWTSPAAAAGARP